MATDFWPSEEIMIVPGFEIGFCYCDGTIAEGYPCKMGSTVTTAGIISVTTAAANGDAIGVALKAGSSGAYIPVCFYGLCKLKTYHSTGITAGDLVVNSAESGVLTANVVAADATLKLFGGSSYVLGLAFHTSSAKSDEILVLVGKCI